MTVYEKFIAVQNQLDQHKAQGVTCGMIDSATINHVDASKCLQHGQYVYAEQHLERAAKYLWATMRPEGWSK